MSCEYCEANGILKDSTWDNGDGVIIEFDDDSIVATGFYDGGYCAGTARLQINYCPMCGEKLGGDDHE